MEKTARQKTKENEVYKVKPNLSLTGKDIKYRLANGTLKLRDNGQYSIDKELDQARRMNRLELQDALRTQTETAGKLRESLNKNQK